MSWYARLLRNVIQPCVSSRGILVRQALKTTYLKRYSSKLTFTLYYMYESKLLVTHKSLTRLKIIFVIAYPCHILKKMTRLNKSVNFSSPIGKVLMVCL